jgi:hypothetical protein
MQHSPIDELRAFELATQYARRRPGPWLPSFSISEYDGYWRISASGDEDILVVRTASGEVVDLLNECLDPVVAFRTAREYAAAHHLPWDQPFFVNLEPDWWRVQSGGTMGGQQDILVAHAGHVIRHTQWK